MKIVAVQAIGGSEPKVAGASSRTNGRNVKLVVVPASDFLDDR